MLSGRLPRGSSAALGALCAALVVAGMGCAEPAPARPNLLLITIDTLRPDRLACYGGPPDVGTSICALAEGGARFVWAFSTAPYTAPSIASILTSRYPAQHGVSQAAISFLDARIVSVAEILRDAGYTTAAFVSNPVLDPARSLDQGFDVYDMHLTRRERNRPGFEEREAEATTSAALRWAKLGARPPWFLWVHFQDPHGPYEPPDAPPTREDPDSAVLRVQVDHSGRGGIPAYQALPGLFTVGAYEERYLDEIRYLDPHVKRLVDGLDALGDPPALVLTSDHGEAFGEDGYFFAHGHSVGLDQIRVPLLWRPPGGRGGDVAVESAPVSLLDVAPTLLAVAGQAPPPEFLGHPLPGQLEGAPPRPGEGPIFAEHALQMAVVMGPTYYARNRWAPDDPRSGDEVGSGDYTPIDQRTAHLDPEGRPWEYAVAPEGDGPARDLELLLSGFLDAARERRELRREDVPPEVRARLEALGYLD